MSEAEKEKTPDELVNCGEWEVDPFYIGERRGKIFRSRSTSEVECFQSYEGATYRAGDTVYMDAVSTDAYLIGTITAFKQTKRDVLLSVTRFYRPEEVPEDSLFIMAQERGEGGETMAKQREIFSSDNQSSHSISLLRGHCTILHVKDIVESRALDLSQEDTFFSCVVYNQESTRLASHNGEIRVGPSHQAKLPPESTCSVGEEPDRDELLWRPGQISTQDEDKYIKLARTFRLVLLEQGNIHESEKSSRCRDMLLDDAMTTLHRCGYSYSGAIEEMNANDKLLSADANFMTNEDTKKFGKGIKTLGKNFTRISRELLPLHNRDQLVAFYYLWKKSGDAIKPKALNNRSRAAAGLRRGKKENQSKNSRPPSRELVDYASASENEVESLDEAKRQQYACHHCYGSESRDWHHAGRESPMLLCTECRLFYKKYGQMRSVEKPAIVPSCLFKRSNSETDQEEESGVRTRAGKSQNGRKRSPSYGDEVGSVNGDDEKKGKRMSNGKRKKSLGEKNGKRRREDTIKEDDEGDDDKKSSSISPSPSGEKEMKKEEEEEKEKTDNDVNEENGVKGMKDENGEDGETKEGPSTANGGEIEGEEREDASDENETAEECNEAIEENANFKCATFFRVYRRGNGNSCSRTDLVFTATQENIDYRKGVTVKAEEEKKKLEEEKKKAEKVAEASESQAGPSNAGIVHPMPRMAIPPMQQPAQDMQSFLQQMARQSIPNFTPHHFQFDPRTLQQFMNPQMMAAIAAEQNQQMAVKIASQREMEAAMRRQSMSGHLINGIHNPLNPFGAMPLNGVPAHLVSALHHNGAAAAAAAAAAAHDPLASFARQQQLHSLMAAGVPPAAAAAAAAAVQPPMTGDMETAMRLQEMMQAMANAQHAAAAPPPPPPPPVAPPDVLQQLMNGRDAPSLALLYQQIQGMNGMQNGNGLQSEMMRRLHHDSFKQ